MEKTSEKKRSTNFTSQEVDLLQELVQQHWTDLESKRSNPTSWKQKQEAWNAVAVAFNAANSNTEPRSAVVLKKKWENAKEQLKDKVAGDRTYQKRTGGGPTQKITFSSGEEQLLSLINIQATGNESVFDCDFDATENFENEVNNEVNVQPEWRNLNAAQLQSPLSEPLVVTIVEDKVTPSKPAPKRKLTPATTYKKWCALADKKAECAELKIKRLKREVDQMEEKHLLELEGIRAKQRQEQERHDMEMQILKLKLMENK